MRLIDTNHSGELHKGDTVYTFRGEEAVLEGMTEPHKPSSTGRVQIRVKGEGTSECFPSVIGAVWVK